jgi:hypothetical protein
VVDGQQRLTSLALTLSGRSSDARFNVYFDPDALEFFAKGREAPKPHWVPVPELRDAANLGEWLLSWSQGTPERRRAALEVGARLREYEIPVFTVRAEDDAPLREVFRRMNLGGRRLVEEDVFDTTSSDGARLSDVAGMVTELGFGDPDPGALKLAAMLMAGLDVTRTITAQTRSGAGFSDAGARLGSVVPRLARVLPDVVTFLRDEASIPAAGLLPYHHALVLLPRLFERFPTLNARNRRLLRRYVWRSFQLQRAGIPQHLRRPAIWLAEDRLGQDELLQRLLSIAPTSAPAWTCPEKSRLDAAQTRIGLLGLASLAPQDPITAAPAALNLPPRRLFPAGPSRLGNLMFGKTLSIRQLLGPEASASRASHAIDDACAALLQRDERDEFFEHRERTLERVVEALVAATAEFGADDRPSLRTLFVA